MDSSFLPSFNSFFYNVALLLSQQIEFPFGNNLQTEMERFFFKYPERNATYMFFINIVVMFTRVCSFGIPDEIPFGVGSSFRRFRIGIFFLVLVVLIEFIIAESSCRIEQRNHWV